jgi:hypothetical protein
MAGFTVTTTVTGIPAQPLLVGVITYVTSWGALLVFVRV